MKPRGFFNLGERPTIERHARWDPRALPCLPSMGATVPRELDHGFMTGSQQLDTEERHSLEERDQPQGSRQLARPWSRKARWVAGALLISLAIGAGLLVWSQKPSVQGVWMLDVLGQMEPDGFKGAVVKDYHKLELRQDGTLHVYCQIPRELDGRRHLTTMQGDGTWSADGKTLVLIIDGKTVKTPYWFRSDGALGLEVEPVWALLGHRAFGGFRRKDSARSSWFQSSGGD